MTDIVAGRWKRKAWVCARCNPIGRWMGEPIPTEPVLVRGRVAPVAVCVGCGREVEAEPTEARR